MSIITCNSAPPASAARSVAIPTQCEKAIEAGELVSPEQLPATSPEDETEETGELPPLGAAFPDDNSVSNERGSPIRVLSRMARATELARAFDDNDVPLKLPKFDLSDDLQNLQPPTHALPAE